MAIFIVIIICIIVAIIARNNIARFSRDDLMNLYSSLLSDMNVDYGDNGMSPTNIGNIQTSLNNFTARVEEFSKQSHKFTEQDILWFTNLIIEFRESLILWIRRHESELQEYEREVEHIADDSQSGAIRLASKRLETQIGILSKIQ